MYFASLFSLVLVSFPHPILGHFSPFAPETCLSWGYLWGPSPGPTSQAGHLPGLDSTIHFYLGYINRHYLYAKHYLKEMGLSIIFATLPLFF